MFSEIVKQLRDNHRVYFGSVSKPDIELTHTTNHPNSRIARLSVRWSYAEKTVCLKLLYPDLVDGRSNRSDRRYKEEQIQTEYDVLKKLHQAFDSYPDLGVVKPVACFPEYLVLVTEEQPGMKFSSILGNAKIFSTQDHIKNLMQRTYLCGRWLRFFQGFMQEDGNQRYDFKEVFDYCDVRLDILAHHRPGEFTEGLCRRIQHFVREQVAQLENGALQVAGRHNDYGPNNMIISGQKLILLDFSGFSYGPAPSDYIKFWSGLDSMKGSPFVSVKTVQKLQEAFIDGYGRRIDSGDPLFTILRIAYMLDKMGDIWLDWATFPWMSRPVYKRLYRGYLAWLQGHCQLYQ